MAGKSGFGSVILFRPCPAVNNPFLPISELLVPSSKTFTLSRRSENEFIQNCSPPTVTCLRVSAVRAALRLSGSCQFGSTLLGSKCGFWFSSLKSTSQKSLTPSPS